MSKDILDTLTENLFELNPLVHKRLLKFDRCPDKAILPINQMMVLGVLYEEESLSISEIGKKIYISKPQMTSIIDKLIKEGFVERVNDKADRRVININITEKGRTYAGDISGMLKENMRRKLAVLSEEKLECLASSIERAISILKSVE